jgi:hypothetical protein
MFYKINELKLSIFADIVSKSYILDTFELARKSNKKSIPKITNCQPYTIIAQAAS